MDKNRATVNQGKAESGIVMWTEIISSDEGLCTGVISAREIKMSAIGALMQKYIAGYGVLHTQQPSYSNLRQNPHQSAIVWGSSIF